MSRGKFFSISQDLWEEEEEKEKREKNKLLEISTDMEEKGWCGKGRAMGDNV